MEIAPAEIAAWIVGTALAWAGMAKIVRFDRWSTALAAYGPTGARARALAVSLPPVELTVAALFAAGHARPAAAATIALLGAFSLSILNAHRTHGDRLPCGCFGGADRRDYRLLLARNAVLGVLAGAVLLLPGERRLTVALPGSGDLAAALLAVAGVALIAWTLGQVAASRRGSR